MKGGPDRYASVKGSVFEQWTSIDIKELLILNMISFTDSKLFLLLKNGLDKELPLTIESTFHKWKYITLQQYYKQLNMTVFMKYSKTGLG